MTFNKYLFVLIKINLILILNLNPTSCLTKSLNKNMNMNKMEKTSKITIYNDKELTSKLFDFSGITFEIFKEKGTDEGIKFSLNKMDNKQNAENYFSKITKKEGADTYTIYYSSTPECDILHKKNPAVKMDVVSIGVTDISKKNTFIALSFDGAGQDQLKFTKLINDSCISYRAKAKKLYNKFNELANKYFKEKKDRIGLNEKASKLQQINKKNTKELGDLNTEKKTLTDKLDADRKELEKLKKEADDKKNMLVRKYTDLNNAKEEKAKNDQLLNNLNKKLAEAQKSASQKKTEFEKTDKDKDQKRKELDSKNKQVNKTQKNLEKLEEELKKQDELVNKVETELNKISSDIQSSENKIADNKNKINKEQGAIDDIQSKDVELLSKDNKKNLDKIAESIKKMKLDIQNLDKDLIKDGKLTEKLKEILNNILNDPDQKINSKKDLANKLEDEIKEYLDNMKKIFPLIPEIYFENIWKMVNVNHSEAINYLFGIRPSIFSLYDYLYSKKHPEITINDVDYQGKPKKKSKKN